MSDPDVAPVNFDPETAGALAAVHAWGQAFNARDLDRLLALAAPDLELATRHRPGRGPDAVRRLLHLQSYGVAQHVRAQRYIARGATVVVEALIELRWVDSGELAESMQGVAVFDVRDGHISRFRPLPDLVSGVPCRRLDRARRARPRSAFVAARLRRLTWPISRKEQTKPCARSRAVPPFARSAFGFAG